MINLKRFFKVLLLFLFLIFVIESILRFKGIKPYPKLIVDKEKSVPDEYAGFSSAFGPYPLPGKFKVTFNGDKWCNVTHTKDSCRITRLETHTTDYTKKPKINIYGCSFTWGEGINDSSTYPFLVQNAMQEYNVQNKGVFAAGNLLAYLQIKDEIKSNQQPTIALVAYASFHDQRNTMNREWATTIKESVLAADNIPENRSLPIDRISFIDTLKFPNARLLNDSICISYQLLNGDLFPFSRYLSVCNVINYFLSQQDEKKINSNKVTRKLFKEINELCKKHEIRLIITCIDNDKNTEEMQSYFRSLKIEYLSFGVDYSNDRNYNLYPDSHPNEKANAIYAKKIIDYLVANP